MYVSPSKHILSVYITVNIPQLHLRRSDGFTRCPPLSLPRRRARARNIAYRAEKVPAPAYIPACPPSAQTRQ